MLRETLIKTANRQSAHDSVTLLTRAQGLFPSNQPFFIKVERLEWICVWLIKLSHNIKTSRTFDPKKCVSASEMQASSY